MEFERVMPLRKRTVRERGIATPMDNQMMTKQIEPVEHEEMTPQATASTQGPDAAILAQEASAHTTGISVTTRSPTMIEKLNGLRWSVTLNATNTVFSQFTYFGSAFVIFLDQLGLSKADIGLVLSLIPLANMFAIFIAPMTARHGYKRTFILFFGLRKVITALLLLTPWVVTTFGAGAAFAFVAGVVGLFATFRTVEETAYYPWYQEFVPRSVQGKYSAWSNIATALVGVISVAIAGWVIAVSESLLGFMLLITAGVFFGLISTWCGSFIPGGAPVVADATKRTERSLGDALRDKNLMRYLVGLALITLGTVPLASFLPLYLQEMAGLSASAAIFVQIGTLLGTVSSSYLWGWAADRYGGRPVMLTGVLLFITVNVLWWAMPRGLTWGLYVALAIAFGQGMANLGWGIGATRLLFGSVVPPAKKMDYLALWFAWAGLVAGISQLAGGYLLEIGKRLAGEFWGIPLDQYALLFALAIGAPILSILALAAIRGDSNVSMGQFAGLFLRGNPFMAMSSLVKYYSAPDEYTVVRTTERLGQTRSSLAVNELVDALHDPRFNVRFEAIQAAARMNPDPQLTAKLVDILNSKNPALSVLAAWALGRIGDPNAISALRLGLDSPYKSIQAHCARALGTLKDKRSIPTILTRLETERDEGLLLAYCSALGNMRASKATFRLLELLHASDDEEMCWEATLALARIVGNEKFFIQLWRNTKHELGTPVAQALTRQKKSLAQTYPHEPELKELLNTAIDAFAREDLQHGAHTFGTLLQTMPLDSCEYVASTVAEACSKQLRNEEPFRNDYLLLAVHTFVRCLA